MFELAIRWNILLKMMRFRVICGLDLKAKKQTANAMLGMAIRCNILLKMVIQGNMWPWFKD